MPKEKKPFVDFRAIRTRITMEQVLTHYGVLGAFKRTGYRLSGACPIHNGNNPTQFRVDTEKNLWNCFSECKQGGNVLDFIAKKEDISVHDAALRACEWFNIPLHEISRQASGNESTKPSEPRKQSKAEPCSLAAEGDTPNSPLKFRLEKLNRSHPYFTERGVSQETVIDFGLGYFTGEKGLMVGRIVIPIHNVSGELIAYSGRWPGDPPKDTPKYKLPAGFKKSLELFNLDRASKEAADKPLVIVEGFFDAIKLHEHGCRKVVALMGGSMSAAQEELIRHHTHSHSQVIVALDEDEAGRVGRQDIACRLSKFCFVKVQVFEKPSTQPEHLSAQEVEHLFGDAL